MRQLGLPIAVQLQNARVLLQREVTETYPDGKGTSTTSRGFKQYLVGTTPTISGSDIIFTTCSGTTTVSPSFGGTLNLGFPVSVYGIC